MKKFVFLCKLLLILCITKVSLCSADVSLKKEKLESQIIKIKIMAKRLSVIKKLTENSSENEDPFKDFDYMSPNFYSCKSVK